MLIELLVVIGILVAHLYAHDNSDWLPSGYAFPDERLGILFAISSDRHLGK